MFDLESYALVNSEISGFGDGVGMIATVSANGPNLVLSSSMDGETMAAGLCRTPCAAGRCMAECTARRSRVLCLHPVAPGATRMGLFVLETGIVDLVVDEGHGDNWKCLATMGGFPCRTLLGALVGSLGGIPRRRAPTVSMRRGTQTAFSTPNDPDTLQATSATRQSYHLVSDTDIAFTSTEVPIVISSAGTSGGRRRHNMCNLLTHAVVTLTCTGGPMDRCLSITDNNFYMNRVRLVRAQRARATAAAFLLRPQRLPRGVRPGRRRSVFCVPRLCHAPRVSDRRHGSLAGAVGGC